VEDKTFDLIEKMYSEFTNRFDGLQKSLTEFKTETAEGFAGIESRLTKIETSIENEIKPNIKTSLEGYQTVYEKLQEHDKRFDELSEKIEKQDLEIRVIKAVK